MIKIWDKVSFEYSPWNNKSTKYNIEWTVEKIVNLDCWVRINARDVDEVDRDDLYDFRHWKTIHDTTALYNVNTEKLNIIK